MSINTNSKQKKKKKEIKSSFQNATLNKVPGTIN